MIIFGVLIILLITGSLIMMSVLMNQVRKTSVYQYETYKRHYAYIHSNDNSKFWEEVYAGALGTGKETGAYVENFGANLTVDYDEDDLIRMAIEASVDGIILEAGGDENTAELIREATDAGIPVVTLVNDFPGSGRICYVGISSYAMGRQYGDRIVRHMADGENDHMKVDVILNSGNDDNSSALVVSGIQDVFNELGYGNMLETEAISIDSETAFSADESIRDIFLQEELPGAIVGLDAVHTRCLFQSAVDYNKVGDVYIYGFDSSQDILEAVSKNIVEATLAVNTEEMGSACVKALEEYISTGYVSEYFSMDTELIMAAGAEKILNENREKDE